MDPQVVLDALFTAINDGEWDDAHTALIDLETWQLRGGYMPSIESVDIEVPDGTPSSANGNWAVVTEG